MDSAQVAASASAIVGVILISAAVGVGFYVWSALALSKVFTKLGEEGWKAWVPFVNTAGVLQLGGYSWLWLFGFFVPVLNVVAYVVYYVAVHNINRRFGKSAGSTVLALFFYPIWASVLGFGSARPSGWTPNQPVAAYPQPTYGNPQFAPPAPAPGAPLAAPAPTTQFPPAPPAPPAPSAVAAPPAPRVVTAPPLPPMVSAPPAPPAAPAATSFAPPAPPAPVSIPAAAPVAASAPAALIPPSPASVDPNPWAPPITVVPGVPVAQPPSEPVRAPFDAEDDDGATIITNPGAAAVDEEYEATVIARRRVTWSLETEAGDHIALTGSTALLGRNPEPSGEDDAAQLVKLIDPGKTVSKTHARIDLGGDTWTITDLHSTNGVTLTTEDGAEHEVEANVPTPLSERFQLGDFVLRISQSK